MKIIDRCSPIYYYKLTVIVYCWICRTKKRQRRFFVSHKLSMIVYYKEVS